MHACIDRCSDCRDVCLETAAQRMRAPAARRAARRWPTTTSRCAGAPRSAAVARSRGARWPLPALAPRPEGPSWREVLGHPAVALGLAGAAVTLGAAPVDDAWHRGFGRDAVIWSPPHMLGVAGTLAIAAAVVLDVHATGTAAARRFRPLAGAALIGAALIPVLEYDLDVPQFAATFYLPVLVSGLAFGFGLLRLATRERWPATRAAATYTLLMALLGLALRAGDFPAPVVPLVVAPALVFDALGARGSRSPAIAALALVAATYIAYVPALDYLGSGVEIDAGALAGGLPLALAGALLALAPARGAPAGA